MDKISNEQIVGLLRQLTKMRAETAPRYNKLYMEATIVITTLVKERDDALAQAASGVGYYGSLGELKHQHNHDR